jgi:hypothetical protein
VNCHRSKDPLKSLINIKDKDGESYNAGKRYRLTVPPSANRISMPNPKAQPQNQGFNEWRAENAPARILLSIPA